MIKKIAIFGLVAFLSGCTSTYNLNGKRFENQEAFQVAVENERSAAVSQVQTLPAPLSKKKLIAALPSEQALYEENTRRQIAHTGRPVSGIALEQITNLSKSNYKLTRVLFEGVQRRGIYSGVEIRDMPGMAVSIEPSLEYDVIYYTEPAIGAGQLFYSSVKHGRQVFAYDRSVSGVTGKVNSFIEAVQLQAIKE